MGITGLKLVCQQGTFLPEPIKVIHYLPVSRVQKLLHSLASDSFLHLENQQHSIIRSFSDLAPFLTSSMLSEPQFLQWLPSDNPAQSPFLEVSWLTTLIPFVVLIHFCLVTYCSHRFHRLGGKHLWGTIILPTTGIFKKYTNLIPIKVYTYHWSVCFPLF